jgi:hypothetical protein
VSLADQEGSCLWCSSLMLVLKAFIPFLIPEHGCNDPLPNQGSVSFRHTERQRQVFHHFAKDLWPLQTRMSASPVDDGMS